MKAEEYSAILLKELQSCNSKEPEIAIVDGRRLAYAAAFAWSGFDSAKPLTWLFVGGLTFLLLAIAALYPGSELHRRNMIGQLASDFFNTLHSQKLKG